MVVRYPMSVLGTEPVSSLWSANTLHCLTISLQLQMDLFIPCKKITLFDINIDFLASQC